MIRIAQAIDRLCLAVSRAATWLVIAMVLLGAFNAIARYLGRFIGVELSSNTLIEGQWYLFSAVFLLASAGTLARDGHVRVDVFYGRLSPRGKAVVDLLGTLLLMLPFCIFALSVSIPSVLSSWKILEGSPDPGGLPRYPIKTLVPIAFGLLILQGIARATLSFAVLRGHPVEGNGA
jgi:TRAP-type mannitol/chloroaromatic compound transport system permease small subunit